MKPLGRRYYKDETGGKHTCKVNGKTCAWWNDLAQPSKNRYKCQNKIIIEEELNNMCVDAFKETSTIYVEDWDNIVKGYYGKIYNFQQQDGCKARGYYEVSYSDDDEYNNTKLPVQVNGDKMGINFNVWVGKDFENKFFKSDHSAERLFWERNYYPFIGCVIKDLYDNGIIDHKVFLIEVDW